MLGSLQKDNQKSVISYQKSEIRPPNTALKICHNISLREVNKSQFDDFEQTQQSRPCLRLAEFPLLMFAGCRRSTVGGLLVGSDSGASR